MHCKMSLFFWFFFFLNLVIPFKILSLLIVLKCGIANYIVMLAHPFRRICIINFPLVCVKRNVYKKVLQILKSAWSTCVEKRKDSVLAWLLCNFFYKWFPYKRYFFRCVGGRRGIMATNYVVIWMSRGRN